MNEKNIIDLMDFVIGRECDICGSEFKLDSVEDMRRICNSCSSKLKRILFDYDRSKVKSAEMNFNDIPESCRNCHTHPSNGGSGICFCTLCTQR